MIVGIIGLIAAWRPAVNDMASQRRYDCCSLVVAHIGQEHRVARRKSKEDDLLTKIRSLPPERAAEVEDFVDFLHQREQERALGRATTKLSEAAFAKIWDNPDDAEYDRL